MRFRHLHGEMMDRDELPAALLHDAFLGLERLHSLSNAGSGIVKQLRALLPRGDLKSISLLELGCGDGSLLSRVIAGMGRYHTNVLGVGVDINQNAISLARSKAASNQEYLCADACDFESTRLYDLGFTSLFLHHLTSTQTIRVLKRLARSCRYGFVCFDLNRSIPAWITTWIACRAVSRCPIVHNDGPRSIEAAYRRDELLQIAALHSPQEVVIKHAFPIGYFLVSKPII